MATYNQENKTPTPPYLTVAKLNQVIELVANRNFTEITPKQFLDRGFNRSDAVWAVSTLKFLGVADEEGKSTPLMQKLRLQGEARKVEFEKIVRQAYGKLFNAVAEPQNLPMDQLKNEFFAQYQVTPRVARSAIPVFLRLCEYGGLKEEGTVATKKFAPKDKSIHVAEKPTGKPASRSLPQGSTSVSVAEGRITLLIPEKLKERLLDDETIEEDWRKVRGVLRDFADKHIPIEPSP